MQFVTYPCQDDDTSAAQKCEHSVEYLQLCLLRRVKRDKEMKKDRFPVEHLGYKVRKQDFLMDFILNLI
jgi:hypothetical protein